MECSSQVLTNPIVTEQVASAYSGCVVERLPGAAEGEAMLLIAGPITSRIQAVQAASVAFRTGFLGGFTVLLS